MKVEVAVLGSPSLIVFYGLCGRKATAVSYTHLSDDSSKVGRTKNKNKTPIFVFSKMDVCICCVGHENTCLFRQSSNSGRLRDLNGLRERSGTN